MTAARIAGGGVARPLICHVVFRFDYGGLENGLVNLINGLPAEEFRHAIVALTTASDFRRRLTAPGVEIHELGKRPGKDPASYLRLFRLLRRLRPAIVHTRNIGTLDCAPIAALAGVPRRVHGEHGWDVHDPDGTQIKYLRRRRWLGRWVHQFVTVSDDLRRWLTGRVGIAERKVRRICNGVDTERFAPRADARQALPGDLFPPGCVVFGSVTRFSDIKDPLNLVRAFIAAVQPLADRGVAARLLMAGDGPLRQPALELLAAAGCARLAWLPGSRDDIAALLGAMDVFVLGSYREGISNTILEAMATGVPVVATATGGNLELVLPGSTGALVPPGDTVALSAALVEYGLDPGRRRDQGAAARARATQQYSLARMIGDYRGLYRGLTEARA